MTRTRAVLLMLIASLLITPGGLPVAEARDPLAVPNDLPTQTFDGAAAPTGWSVVNNVGTDGWRFDNPRAQANNTGGTGNFAIADSLNAGAVNMDTELRSPALNLAGTTAVQLRFKASLPSTGQSNELAEADVSTNGGVAWTNVWKGDAGVNYGQVTVNVTAQLANQATVLIRFHYYNANQAGSWLLDDVQLLARAPATPTGLQASAVATQNTITLTWTRASTDETGFKIERSPDGAAGWTQVGTTPAGVTSFADIGVTCATRSFYRVRAFSQFGDSATSAPANDQAKPCDTPVIEFNQGLGQQSGRFVAGRDTAILVYLANPVTVDPAQQSAAVKRNGAALATLTPQPATAPTNVLVFTCPSRSACGDWQAGTYSVDVTLGGVVSSLQNISLVDRRTMRVLAVPVKASYGGTVKAVTTDDWKRGGELMRTVYPVSGPNFRWTTGPELDASTSDIFSDDGQRQIWQALSKLQPATCTNNQSGANCFDKIIGFVAPGLPNGLAGYTMGNPANIVMVGDGLGGTVAHEVGHTFGLGDEYNAQGGQYACDINPPPPAYNAGGDSAGCPNSTTQPFTGEGLGAVKIIASLSHPFEIGGRGLIPTDLGNFMGSINDQAAIWISPDSWKQIFDTSPPIPVQAAAAPLAVQPYRVIKVSGSISQAGAVTFEPGYTFTTTGSITPFSSTYQIQAVNTLSKTLISQGLDLRFLSFDGLITDPGAFSALLPFPANTAAFRILKGATVLKVIPVSANGPTVTVTSPSAGGTVSGSTTINWTASDPDGGQLSFDVEYNPTGAADGWMTLAADITTTQWIEDFTDLPGGSQAQIRVTASDGVNSTAGLSGKFSVPVEPPLVIIDAPASDARYRFGGSVPLNGIAYDEQLNELPDSALIWSSNLVSGTLGTGSLVFVNSLPVGQHTITLSVLNSLGATAIATTTVTIDPARVYVPLSLRNAASSW